MCVGDLKRNTGPRDGTAQTFCLTKSVACNRLQNWAIEREGPEAGAGRLVLGTRQAAHARVDPAKMPISKQSIILGIEATQWLILKGRALERTQSNPTLARPSQQGNFRAPGATAQGRRTLALNGKGLFQLPGCRTV